MIFDDILRKVRLRHQEEIRIHTPAPPPGVPAVQVTVSAPPPPPARPTVTGNQQAVSDIADALHTLPTQIEGVYVTNVLRAAAKLGNGVPDDIVQQKNRELEIHRPQPMPLYYKFPYGNVRDPWFNSAQNQADSNQALRNVAMMARNNVFDVVDQVNSFVSRAKNAGFQPPDNPFALIAELNAKRAGWTPVSIDVGLADEVIQNIGFYLELIKAEREGKVNLEKQNANVAQLSHVGMSFEGFGGSGNTAADLMKFLPDLDEIKVQKAKEALSVLDFKKRTPRIIFTSNYSPDGVAKGAVIGWRKMPDASGYIVKRRNILDGQEVSYMLSNENAKLHYDHIRDYVKTWILGFYKEISPDQIYAFLDSGVTANGYYTYKIQAYQSFNESRDVFRVDMVPANLSQAQRAIIARDLEALDPGKGETISPYPILAKSLLGNDKFDWILAACNIRASTNRGDPRSTSRKYSYLSAQLDFLYAQMDAGLLLIPKDINQVIQNVTDGVTKFGVTQMLMEVLQETGALYHFDGIDPKSDSHFDRVGNEDIATSSLLSTIVAAIDPETATMDLKSLASNLPTLLDRGVISTNEKFATGEKPNVQARTAEIDVPFNVENTDSINAEDEIQFLQRIPAQDLNRAVDLTTFEGISKFIRTVRVFADVTADRSPPIPPPAPVAIPIPAVPPAVVAQVTPAPVLIAQHVENQAAARIIKQIELDQERKELLRERIQIRARKAGF